GSMLMNIAANMLGLGNAATPLGLRAMKDLESLNPRPGTATNAMCTFLAINTSGVQLIPVTAIAILAANKSTNPTAIVGTAIMSTACAAVGAVIMAKFLARLPMFRLEPATVGVSKLSEATPQNSAEEKSPVKEAAALQPLQWWGALVIGGYGLFFLWLFVRVAFPGLLGGETAAEAMKQSAFVRIVDSISKLSVPFLLS